MTITNDHMLLLTAQYPGRISSAFDHVNICVDSRFVPTILHICYRKLGRDFMPYCSLFSLQEKVAKCLEDGVRLPILNVETLKCESNNLKGDYERAVKVSIHR